MPNFAPKPTAGRERQVTFELTIFGVGGWAPDIVVCPRRVVLSAELGDAAFDELVDHLKRRGFLYRVEWINAPSLIEGNADFSLA